MKRIFYILCSAAALTGCAKGDVLERSNSGRIEFESFVAKPSTMRAAPVDQFADGATMQIWGYTSPSPITTISATTSPIAELNPAQVTRTSGSWSYSPPGFWAQNLYHSFTALSPATANVVYNNGVVAYDNPTEIAQQQDLMFAEAIYAQAPYTGNAAKISFTFRHALSQIRFAGVVTQAAGKTEIRVKSVKIANDGQFIKTATISIADQKNANPVWGITNSPEVSSYTAIPAAAVELPVVAAPVSADYRPIVHGAGHTLMVLPQTPTGTIRFEVELLYKDAEGEKSVTAKFESAAITWESNYVYSYKFGIDMNKALGSYIVSFDPSIDPWGAENTTTPS